MTGFLTTYRKIKGVFKRPKFKLFLGLWKNDPNLPVSRSGYIRLAKLGQYYYIKKSTLLEDKSKTTFDDDGRPIKYMYHSNHNIKPDYAWNRGIRKKLRKFGLGWLPPIIITPWWLKIAVYNWDVIWKWKFNEVRYEFPPQFTIVFFGLCLTITMQDPTDGEYTDDYQYWEAILNYLYKYNGDMYKTVYYDGVWENGNESWFSVRPEYIVNENLMQEYIKAVNDYRKMHPDKQIF